MTRRQQRRMKRQAERDAKLKLRFDRVWCWTLPQATRQVSRKAKAAIGRRESPNHDLKLLHRIWNTFRARPARDFIARHRPHTRHFDLPDGRR
jgi:hypothetical protein